MIACKLKKLTFGSLTVRLKYVSNYLIGLKSQIDNEDEEGIKLKNEFAKNFFILSFCFVIYRVWIYFTLKLIKGDIKVNGIK